MQGRRKARWSVEPLRHRRACRASTECGSHRGMWQKTGPSVSEKQKAATGSARDGLPQIPAGHCCRHPRAAAPMCRGRTLPGRGRLTIDRGSPRTLRVGKKQPRASCDLRGFGGRRWSRQQTPAPGMGQHFETAAMTARARYGARAGQLRAFPHRGQRERGHAFLPRRRRNTHCRFRRGSGSWASTICGNAGILAARRRAPRGLLSRDPGA
jgi:hypothetical protein